MTGSRGAKPNLPDFTGEQQYVIDTSAEGGDGIVIAYAGAGKTTVTIGIAHKRPRAKFHYAAYNRKAAMEAKRKVPRNVTASTMHSLAFGTTGIAYKAKLGMPRQRYNEVADVLKLEPIQIGEKRYLQRWQVAAAVLTCVKNFCASADDEPAIEHVHPIPRVEAPYIVGVAAAIVAYAERAWEDIKKIDGKVSWYKNHDYYLKIWALTNPKLHVDCLMVDEAQDSNPVVMKVVNDQECQKILVGDPYQQLYAWRGAVDAMATFEADWRLSLTQSFRFGLRIAEEGSKWLKLLGCPDDLVGFDKIDSDVMELDNPRAILCRTNAGVVAEALQVIEKGNTHAIVGGTDEIKKFAWAVQDLQNGRQTAHPDLMGYESWNDVKDDVASGEAEDLKVLVDMVDKYGPQIILNVADTAVDEHEGSPDTVLSTGHKAKGCEWRSVRIAGDFKEPIDPETGEKDWKRARPEFMLLYVAVTRAKEKLDNYSVAWMNDWLAEIGIETEEVIEGTAEEIPPTGTIALARFKKRMGLVA